MQKLQDEIMKSRREKQKKKYKPINKKDELKVGDIVLKKSKTKMIN